MTSSNIVECALHCMEREGCYAVNFKHRNKRNCELTSGLIEAHEMVDDATSDLYIMGEHCRLALFYLSVNNNLRR